jgi:NAD(P)-dependent dehydrogenase (short-subunit alcohol dehydrogenase family)
MLKEETKANPGMDFIKLDTENPRSIESVADSLIARHPQLNVVINSAGIMKVDNVDKPMDDALMSSVVTIGKLRTDAHEVLTGRVSFLRNGAGPNDAEATKQVNDWFETEPYHV